MWATVRLSHDDVDRRDALTVSDTLQVGDNLQRCNLQRV
jgi:hypothetical protein